jgi:Sulfatase
MSTLSGSLNILLFIFDDLGKDVIRTGIFPPIQALLATAPIDPDPIFLPRQMKVVTNDGTGQITGNLPHLSLLLRNGVYFQQAWAQPACSPTRASIYTGLHPWKSGVGSPVGTPELDPGVSYTALPELLPNEYVSGIFGKWHLGERAGTRPTDHGWDKHVGTLNGVLPAGTPPDNTGYTDWEIVDSNNGYIPVPTTDYATRRTVKEAGAWINAQDPATPWFVTVAFHAPHDPFHIPPHGYDRATAGDPTSYDYMFNVMMQNVDTNIGRLLGIVSGGGNEALDFEPIPQAQLKNTVIFCLGDNGSHREIAIQEEKTFAYEGSVGVPLLVVDGKAVVDEINEQPIVPRFLHTSRLNTESQAMVHAVDLYLTIARLADPACSAPSNTDAKDLRDLFTTLLFPTVPRRVDPIEPGEGEIDPPFQPVRSYNFSQWYTSTTQRATIRNNRYKLNYDAANTPVYALYRYENGEIPGREDNGTATNLYDAAIAGTDQDARDNLDVLLAELMNNYRPNQSDSFPA